MKLSDVKGERVFDVIADCIEPIANIANDPDAAAMFKKEKLPEGETPKHFLLMRTKKSLPSLLKTHRKDVIAILSSIEGTSKKKYAQDLTLTKLMYDCIELLNDETFLELFTSAQRKTDNGSSGSAQGSIEEPLQLKLSEDMQ